MTDLLREPGVEPAARRRRPATDELIGASHRRQFGRELDWLAGRDEAPPVAPRARHEPVSLVIPALNEEAGLARTLADARRVFAAGGIPVEIIVVDDGSEDGTADVARRGGARVVGHLYGRGYGYALRSGILAATHDTIIICDADGTYPLDRASDLLAEYGKGYDLVIGARTGPHFRGGLFKGIARRFFHRLCECATGTRIADANSGLRVFRKSAILPYLPMMCTGFSFTTSQTLCFLLLSRPVAYVPIEYHARLGRTKIRHVRDAMRTAQYIFQMFVMFNPVKLFTVMAFVPAAAGLGALLTQAVAAAAGASLAWTPTVVVASMAPGASAVLFGMGFVTYGVSRPRWPDAVSGQAPPTSESGVQKSRQCAASSAT